MLGFGVYLLITGKMPGWWLASSNYKVKTNITRLIGFLYVLPLPSMICLGITLRLANVDLNQVAFIEPLFVLIVIILNAFITFRFREPVESS